MAIISSIYYKPIINTYEVLFIFLCYNNVLFCESDLMILTNVRNNSVLYRCFGANISLNSSIFWTNEDGYVAISKKLYKNAKQIEEIKFNMKWNGDNRLGTFETQNAAKTEYKLYNCDRNNLFKIKLCVKCNDFSCTHSNGYGRFFCNEPCIKGRWGKHCHKKCAAGCEHRTCDVEIGSCDCKEGYTGKTCDEEYPVLQETPKIKNTSYTSVEIDLNNTKYSGNIIPKYISFQYSKIKPGKSMLITWHDVNACYWNYSTLKVPLVCNITNLSIFTKYTLKILLLAEDNKTHPKPFTINFSTTCKELVESNIVIKSFTTSAIMKIHNLDTYSCELKNYVANLSDSRILNNLSTTKQINIPDLTPSTEYSITFKNNFKQYSFKKPFKTICDLPMIENITINIKPKRVFIQWAAKETCITNYSVEIKELNHYYCPNYKNTTVVEKIIGSKNFNFTNTKPYFNYNVTITGQLNGQEGPPNSKVFCTNGTVNLTEENLPRAVRYDSLNNLIIISLPSCELMTAPFRYSIVYICLSKWCRSEANVKETNVIDEKYKIITKSYFLRNVLPYTEYNLTIWTMMFNKTSPYNTSLKIKTKPGAPPPVRNATIFSRSNDSFWIRWKHPYPQYGELEEFRISYSMDNKYFLHAPNANIIDCDLWLNYICAKIQNLQYNKKYYIKIVTKNKNIHNTSTTIVTSTTVQEASTEPLNLKSAVLSDSILELSWYHPYITNGPLVSFKIEIKVNGVVQQNLPHLDVTEPLKQYRYNISVKPAKTYNITVSPNNQYLGKSVWIVFDTDPPSPDLTKPPFISCTESGCCIEIPEPKIAYKNRSVIVKYTSGDKNETVWNSKEVVICIDRKILQSINPKSEIFNHKNNLDILKNNLYIILENQYNNKTKQTVYKFNRNSIEVISNSNSKYLFFLLILLIIPIAIILYFLRRKNECSIVSQIHDAYADSNEGSFNSKTIHRKLPEPEESSLLYESVSNIEILSNLIDIENLKDHIKQSISIVPTDTNAYEELNELQKEFALVPTYTNQSHTIAAMNENKPKNRYINILPYDNSRVILQNSKPNETDYINASYINGYKCDKAYIATQAPKSNTVVDFWKMIWQENVTDIVMVANIHENGKKKCEEYWKDNDSVTFGSFIIISHTKELLPNYIHRKFDVEHQNEKRTVNHLQFTTWPEDGVPVYPEIMATFLQKIVRIPQGKVPIVIHCSDGVGRTGTIILCDINLRMAAKEKNVDFLKTLSNIREHRKNLVDSSEQYIFAHFAVLECLFGKSFKQPLNCQFEQTVKSLLRKKIFVGNVMEYLDDVAWIYAVQYQFPDQYAQVNRHKNRKSNIIPEGKWAIYLPRYPIDDYSSDYINAVYVNSYNQENKFVVTQQPLPNTIGDFWRLVADKNTTLIISLNTINLSDQTSCIFWPENNQIMKPVDFIEVVNKSAVANNGIYDEINLTMRITEEKTRNIKLIQLKEWESSRDFPQNIDNLLTVLEITKYYKDTILITCHDGATASGLFIALYNIVEQMKYEQVCDICHSIRIIRRSRKEFVQPWGQFEFLMKAAVIFLKNFFVLSNLK